MVAKSASAATAALGVSGYGFGLFGYSNPAWIVPLAILIIILVTGVVLSGIRRTNMVNMIVVGITLVSLGFFVIGGTPVILEKGLSNLIPLQGNQEISYSNMISGVLHATALMFVAYTGYGRVATLGEEIVDPRQNLPRAIRITLGLTIFIYAVVLFVAISAVGHESLYEAARGDSATLVAAANEYGIAGSAVYVGIGAVTAMLGVLLNLILGLSRMVLAMSRRGHFPAIFSNVDKKGVTPIPAVLFTGVLVLVLSLFGDVYVTWSLSAFTVLIYYGITNWAAIRLDDSKRMYARHWAWIGLFGCLLLAFWVEQEYWVLGLGLIVIGLIWYAVTKPREKA